MTVVTKVNEIGQPIGPAVTGSFPCPRPSHAPLTGQYGRLAPVRTKHARDLFAAFSQDTRGAGWTYLPLAPWTREEQAREWARHAQASADPMFYAVEDDAGKACGFCSYLRIHPEVGSIEVGYIHFAPRLQRTRLATEAMYLLMRHAFDDLGYRRYEWKCNALNAPSRKAAERFGFTFEGIFRQASITNGRNRDTAWYSIVDGEWPHVRARFKAWLEPANFDEQGRQRRRLADV